MESTPKEDPKPAPAKQPMQMNPSLKSFKPNLNLNSTAFVPSIKPEIKFTPEKAARKEEDKKVEAPAPVKFDLESKASLTLNPNAPVFTPTVPLETLPQPVMSKSKKKRMKKKNNQKEGDKQEDKEEAKSPEQKPAN